MGDVTAQILLDRARAAGLTVRVTAGSDTLVIRGPKHAGALAKELLSNKPAVLALLRNAESALEAARAAGPEWDEPAARALATRILVALDGAEWLEDHQRELFAGRVRRALSAHALADLRDVAYDLERFRLNRTGALAQPPAWAGRKAKGAMCERCSVETKLVWSRALLAWRCQMHRPPEGIDELNVLLAVEADAQMNSTAAVPPRGPAVKEGAGPGLFSGGDA